MPKLFPNQLRLLRKRRKIPKEPAPRHRVLLAGGAVTERTKAPAEAGVPRPTATMILLVLVGANHHRQPHVKIPAEVDGADRVNPSPPHLALVGGGRNLLASHRLLHREIIEVMTGVVHAMHLGNLAVAGDPRVAPTPVMAKGRTPAVAGAPRPPLLPKEDPLEDGEAVIPDLMIVLAAVGGGGMMVHLQTATTTAATPAVHRLTAAIRSDAEKTKNGEEGELVVNKVELLITKQHVQPTIPNVDVLILLRPQPRRHSKLLLLPWAAAADGVVAPDAERMPIFPPG